MKIARCEDRKLYDGLVRESFFQLFPVSGAYLYVCTCMCACMYVDKFVCVHIFVREFLFNISPSRLSICMCACVCMYIRERFFLTFTRLECLSVCLHVCVCTYMRDFFDLSPSLGPICIFARVCVCVCMYVCW